MHFDTDIIRNFLRELPTRKIQTTEMTMATMPSTITKGTLTEERSTQTTTSNHRRDTVDAKEVEEKLNLSNKITDTKITTPGTKSSVDSYGTTTQNPTEYHKETTQQQRTVVMVRQTHPSSAHNGANTSETMADIFHTLTKKKYTGAGQTIDPTLEQCSDSCHPPSGTTDQTKQPIVMHQTHPPSGTTDQTKQPIVVTQQMRLSTAHHVVKHRHTFNRHDDIKNSTKPSGTNSQTKRPIVMMRQMHLSSAHHAVKQRHLADHNTNTQNSTDPYSTTTETKRPVVMMRQIHPSSAHHGAIYQPTIAHSTQRLTTHNSANFQCQMELRPR